MTKKQTLWILSSLFIVFLLGASFLATKYTLDRSIIPPTETDKIGGGFQLISAAGGIVGNGDFRGNWMLMYFGATRCPNHQCQNNLIKIGQIMDLLKDKKSRITPIFISFDTTYDTPDRLMLTMKAYNNRIIALTGGPLALRDLLIRYHAHIQKKRLPNGIEFVQPYDQFIVMDPDGNYNQSIHINEPTEQIVQKLESVIQ